MQKGFMKLSVLLITIIFTISGFSFKKKPEINNTWSIPIVSAEEHYVPSENEVSQNQQKSLGFFANSYYAFCENLGFQESSNNYKAVNRLGYLGKYQFGRSTLKWVGIRSKKKFLNDPSLQERAFRALIAKNKYVLRDQIANYTGKRIGGIKITESSLIAAAHLGGAGNVKKFLSSNGVEIFRDANNIPITKYMIQFGNYDISEIEADRNASAKL